MRTAKILTPKEESVRVLIETESLSTSELARRLNLTQGRISQIKASLKSKGFHDLNMMPILMPSRYFRLHGLHFIAEPYYFYKRFSKNIGKSYYYDKWHIFINTSNIEFQTKRHASFDDCDIDACLRLCRVSLEKAVFNVQSRTGCEIVKENKLNIKLVNHHIAEVNNGIAKLVKEKKLVIKDESGNGWCVVDTSLKREIETIDPVQATDDMKKLNSHFNAMRVKDSPTISDLGKCIETTNYILQDFINAQRKSGLLKKIPISAKANFTQIPILSFLKSKISRFHDVFDNPEIAEHISLLNETQKSEFIEYLYDLQQNELNSYG